MICLSSLDDVILAGSEICKTVRAHQNIEIFAVSILCNPHVQLNLAGMYVQLEYT